MISLHDISSKELINTRYVWAEKLEYFPVFQNYNIFGWFWE